MANDERLTELKRRLVASERMGPGYKDRIEALKRQIAEAEAQDAQPE